MGVWHGKSGQVCAYIAGGGGGGDFGFLLCVYVCVWI